MASIIMSAYSINESNVDLYQNFLTNVYSTASSYDPYELKLGNILRAFEKAMNEGRADFPEATKASEEQKSSDLGALTQMTNLIADVVSVTSKTSMSSQETREFLGKCKVLIQACREWRQFQNLPKTTREAIHRARRGFMRAPRAFFDRGIQKICHFFSVKRLHMSEEERAAFMNLSLKLDKMFEENISKELEGDIRPLGSHRKLSELEARFLDQDSLTPGSRIFQKKSVKYIEQQLRPLLYKRLANIDWTKVSLKAKERKMREIERKSAFVYEQESGWNCRQLKSAKKKLLRENAEVSTILREYIQEIGAGSPEQAVLLFPVTQIGLCALLKESAPKISDERFVDFVNKLQEFWGPGLSELGENAQKNIRDYLACALDSHHLDLVKTEGLL